LGALTFGGCLNGDFTDVFVGDVGGLSLREFSVVLLVTFAPLESLKTLSISDL